MGLVLLLLCSIYALYIFRSWLSWNALPKTILPQNLVRTATVSIIVPVRNEENNITLLLEDLENQSFAKDLFEIIVVDDHSNDGTVNAVKQFAEKSSVTIKLLELSCFEGYSYKKGAVKKGIEEAKGNFILLTDGDCRVQKDWVSLMTYPLEYGFAKFVSGPVCFHKTNSFFEKLQLLEFAGLVGIGGASIARSSPNMCNGANIAYSRSIFYEVKGFEGNEFVRSGDDEFLMHKVAKHYPNGVKFLNNPGAVVHTEAQRDISSFFAQRVRWASKWKYYEMRSVKLTAVMVFITNFALLGFIPVLMFGGISKTSYFSAYFIKFSAELLFLFHILSFFGKRKYLFYAFPVQLLYLPYVVITSVLATKGNYSWKGRKI